MPAERRRPGRRRLPRAVIGMAVLALALSSFPYLYGYAFRPDATRFWAVPPFNAQDANQYLAFTKSVAEGQVLVGNPFTPEPHARRLFLPEIFVQAALCRALGVSPLTSFQISRVVFGVCLLAAAWWFGTLLIARPSLQRLYFAFVCFTAGGGWLVDWLRPGTAHGDEHQPEGNTLYLLGNLPHLVISAALLTALFATRAALGRGQLRAQPQMLLGSTALLAFLLSWTHPWDLLPLALGTGAYGAYLWLEERRLPRASIAHAAAVAAGALPAAIYLTWIIRLDPIYAAMANDVMQVQRWPFYLIAHGVLALPALVVLTRGALRSRYALPICWVVFVFVFLLTPFRLGGKQSRLPGGVHVPLAMLAAVGVDRLARATVVAATRRQRSAGAHRRAAAILSAVPRSRLSRIISLSYLGVAAIGAIAIVHRHWAVYAPRQPDYFQSLDTQRLYEYLDRHGDEQDVTLGGPLTAGWTPTLGRGRTYHGHWHMTLDEARRRAERDWFFTTPAMPGERAAWLAAHGITWVIWFPWEWNHSAVSLEAVPGLQKAFAGQDIALYRFAGDADSR